MSLIYGAFLPSRVDILKILIILPPVEFGVRNIIIFDMLTEQPTQNYTHNTDKIKAGIIIAVNRKPVRGKRRPI